MLGYVVLIVIIIFSFKMSIGLSRHKEAFKTHGIPSNKVAFLQFSSLLYIASLLGYIFTISTLGLIQMPVILVILLPGIILGKKISNEMQLTGVTDGIKAGEVASNIMWLGLATCVFIVGNIVVDIMRTSF